jgi:hypothetical protein
VSLGKLFAKFRIKFRLYLQEEDSDATFRNTWQHTPNDAASHRRSLDSPVVDVADRPRPF